MPRPAWVDQLPLDQLQLVRHRRLLMALHPTHWEWVLERLALLCWDLELVRLGDWVDQRRCTRQWRRAHREVGCSS